MGKIFGILLIVLGIWVGLEIMTEGSDRAFGGLLSGGSADVVEPASAPVTRRVQDSVSDAYEAQEERALQGSER